MLSSLMLIFSSSLSYYSESTASTKIVRSSNVESFPLLSCMNLYLINQEGNGTLGIQINDLLTAIITACATIVGTFIGYVLTIRTTKHLEERKVIKTILKSLRGLISELEDNEKAVQVGEESKCNVWEFVRRQYWFSSPFIEKQLQDNLKQIYDLLDDYNRELSIVRASTPAKVTEYAQKLVNENNLLDMIHVTRNQLQNIAEKIFPKIVPSLGSE